MVAITRMVTMMLLALPAMPAAASEAASGVIDFVSESVPPYSTIIGGKPGGPFTDIVLAVCKRIDIRCDIKALPKRRLEATVEAGRTQGQYPMVRTPEREPLYYFEAGIVDTEYAFYAMKGGAFRYSTPSDLAGKTVVAYGPSGTSQTLNRLLAPVPTARAQLEIDNVTLIRKLAGGRYGADGIIILNRQVAEYLQAQLRIDRIENIGIAAKTQYHIGFSKKTTSPELARRFFNGFDELARSGELRDILARYGLESWMARELQRPGG